jgi:hypothetical protein
MWMSIHILEEFLCPTATAEGQLAFVLRHFLKAAGISTISHAYFPGVFEHVRGICASIATAEFPIPRDKESFEILIKRNGSYDDLVDVCFVYQAKHLLLS